MPALNPSRVLLEILRNAHAGINRTKLYKAFYVAHLVYANSAPGVLTDWPIVHMPNGPGISESYKLLDALEKAGYLEREYNSRGIYKECVYRETGLISPDSIPEQAAEAIRRATAFVLPMTATQVSDLTHEHSRSWIEGRSGEKLDIYTDLIDDEEYDRRNDQLGRLEEQLKAALEGAG